jgi:ankyrin repeat protein
MTPLLVAITNGSAEIVSLLVEAGADIGWGPRAQCTPLVAAVHAGNCDIVSTLLKAGADVNGMTGLHQVTPLIVAATRQNTDMVDLLLRKGADPNLCDATGVCPLFASIQHAASIRHDLSIRGEAHTRNESVSHMLIEAGASLSCSPMHKLAMDMLPTMCSSTLVDAIKAAEARIIAEGTDVVRKPTYYSHF